MPKILFTLLLLSLSSLALAESSPEPSPDLTYKLRASVVKVQIATKKGGYGVGTGVLVGKDLVATNCHVVANAAGISIVKFGNSYAPVGLKADWKHDVCILTFQYLDINPVELGDSEALKYEQDIFSIGFPGGSAKPLLTYGKVKALYPMDDSHIIRTDASFIMGASGSPVFDSSGKLVALSTFKSPGRSAYFYNVPVKWIKALLASPDITSSADTIVSPFWDAAEDDHPYFMRVVLPLQNEAWMDLARIANLWLIDQPASAEANYYAGLAAEKMSNFSQAKKYFTQALSLEPQHSASIFEMAIIASNEGNTTEVERMKLALKAINNDEADILNATLSPPTASTDNPPTSEATK